LICANIQELIKHTKDQDAEKRSLQHALKEIEVRSTIIVFLLKVGLTFF